MKSTKIAKLLILAMAAILSLALVACDSDDVDTEIPSGSSTESFEETDTQPDESENTGSDTVESSAQSDTTDSSTENTEDSSDTESSEAPKFSYFEEDMFEYLSFERSDYIGIEAVISTDFRIDADDVQAYIDNKLLENRIALNYGATMADKPIELIDSAFIYYTGYVDGVAFSGGSNMSDASPYELIIGSGAFIPGFEEALIGLIPAETSKESPAQITVTFPENYGNDLAGKEAVFDIWIVYSIQYDLPEYNESFITDVLKFEAEGDDVIAEYEASVVKTLEEQLAEKKTAVVDEAMWEVLFENFTVLKYPEEQVKSTYDYYIEDFEYNRTMYGYYGYTFETLGDFAIWYMGLEEGADWEAALLDEARRSVSQYMIYHGIAQAEGFTVTDEEYAAQLEYYIEYYKNYGYSDEELEAALGKEYIKESALFNEVYELLTANITVSYEE